ncbi:unnamed protein product [Porites evermanni]|uniref:Ribosomal protein S2 n=1 Tax=Porites evermanni TaxID=104178 RepID=A0ABN8LLA4_9CNID|nr:unnamed protein product [Porites evermanni]
MPIREMTSNFKRVVVAAGFDTRKMTHHCNRTVSKMRYIDDVQQQQLVLISGVCTDMRLARIGCSLGSTHGTKPKLGRSSLRITEDGGKISQISTGSTPSPSLFAMIPGTDKYRGSHQRIHEFSLLQGMATTFIINKCKSSFGWTVLIPGDSCINSPITNDVTGTVHFNTNNDKCETLSFPRLSEALREINENKQEGALGKGNDIHNKRMHPKQWGLPQRICCHPVPTGWPVREIQHMGLVNQGYVRTPSQ